MADNLFYILFIFLLIYLIYANYFVESFTQDSSIYPQHNLCKVNDVYSLLTSNKMTKISANAMWKNEPIEDYNVFTVNLPSEGSFTKYGYKDTNYFPEETRKELEEKYYIGGVNYKNMSVQSPGESYEIYKRNFAGELNKFFPENNIKTTNTSPVINTDTLYRKFRSAPGKYVAFALNNDCTQDYWSDPKFTKEEAMKQAMTDCDAHNPGKCGLFMINDQRYEPYKPYTDSKICSMDHNLNTIDRILMTRSKGGCSTLLEGGNKYENCNDAVYLGGDDCSIIYQAARNIDYPFDKKRILEVDNDKNKPLLPQEKDLSLAQDASVLLSKGLITQAEATELTKQQALKPELAPSENIMLKQDLLNVRKQELEEQYKNDRIDVINIALDRCQYDNGANCYLYKVNGENYKQ